jgi:hypothetical protein
MKQLRAQLYDHTTPDSLSQYHLSEQQIAGLFATETCHPPRFKLPRHAHELASFYIVLEGSLTESSAPSASGRRLSATDNYAAPASRHRPGCGLYGSLFKSIQELHR